jgi:hypothetical protein
MTTRAVDGGAAGGNEKLERTGVLRTWVVVTGGNPECRAEALNPEIERLRALELSDQPIGFLYRITGFGPEDPPAESKNQQLIPRGFDRTAMLGLPIEATAVATSPTA